VIRIETDHQACKKLWQTFAPGTETWDDWDLMYAFHDQDKHHFNFLVHENSDGKADGLVPLVHDTTQNRYMMMAGSYPDGRILWIRHEDFPEVFEAFPERTVLFDLRHSWVTELLERFPQFAGNFAEQDMRYHLVPAEFGFDFDNHINKFEKDKRQKFHYDLRKIRKLEPVLHWSSDNEADLFIELVNRNFGADSDYADEENAKELRRVVDELQQSGRLRTLVIEIEGAKQAVSMSVLHGNKMVALYSSSNNDYSNLGKLTNVETVQESCRLRLDEISFMTGMRWKAEWRMNSEPCITMRKPPGPWPDMST
jgi:hypothetical protein